MYDSTARRVVAIPLGGIRPTFGYLSDVRGCDTARWKETVPGLGLLVDDAEPLIGARQAHRLRWILAIDQHPTLVEHRLPARPSARPLSALR
jgi:hypothetical protein